MYPMGKGDVKYGLSSLANGSRNISDVPSVSSNVQQLNVPLPAARLLQVIASLTENAYREEFDRTFHEPLPEPQLRRLQRAKMLFDPSHRHVM